MAIFTVEGVVEWGYTVPPTHRTKAGLSAPFSSNFNSNSEVLLQISLKRNHKIFVRKGCCIKRIPSLKNVVGLEV